MRYLDAEELNIASRFLFLSMAIIVLEQDMKHVHTGEFKIKEPYLDLLRQMIIEAKSERKQLRKKMHDQDLKVVRLHKDKLFTSFLFICQNREEERNYFNPAIRNKVKQIIYELLTKILQCNHPDISESDKNADE